ncbi:transglutaminase-like domain-containing protein [Coleofasciculus sp. F4-SAH-05]|uniref:transglutaminase-like domain-containing protein n=1 Tax=Coleofasciculus sp. F4-SAH-05 TaxID=3069525 RepID=UPI0033011F3B
MKFNLGCQLNYSVAASSTFIFNLSVVEKKHQRILQESLRIEPSMDYEEYVSPRMENRYLRVYVPQGDLQVSYQATVDLYYRDEDPSSIAENPPDKLPLETLHYLYPSRYCESDRLMRLAQNEFGNLIPDYSRVTAICNWIYDNVTYLSGSTNQHTSAYDTATERAGVCRDFAHLGIAFCRALNIPARFVTGYAYNLEPQDFHAYFEAYLGDRWYLFDPTRLAPCNGLIRIGIGRDAADVAFATIFGDVQMNYKDVFVEAVPDQDGKTPELPDYTNRAIALI